jgi:hypothetical protein
MRGSFRLDTGELDYLPPFLGFIVRRFKTEVQHCIIEGIAE